jgi:hypothetical protein
VDVKRIEKAVKYRVKKLLKTAAAQRPVASVSFASPTALRNYAVSETAVSTSDIKFAYAVKLPEGYKLPVGLQLPLSHIKRAQISLESQNLTVEVSFFEPKSAAAVAWAIATLISPSLRPLEHMSPDVISDNAALLAGHRPHFGAFGGSDASVMESEQARRVHPEDKAQTFFDIAEFNPIGLKLKELMADLPQTTVTPANFNSVNPQSFAALEISDAQLFAPSDLAGLAATGTVLHVQQPVAGLASSLNDILTQPLPPTLEDKGEQTIHWLVRSEKQRRQALIHHAGMWRLDGHWPLASVLLVTNRAGMLQHAVAQIVEQTYPNTEVLVGLHGIDLAHAEFELKNARDLLGDRLRLVALDASTTLGWAYGHLTALSHGEYLAKFDDDDFYGENHLWDAIMSLRYSGAGLFGRTPTMTWLSATDELLMRPFGIEETFNKYIIGATMVINKAALLSVGGWRPSPWAVDKALIDRFTSAGAGVYRAGQMGWVYVRHNQGHTWVRDESAFREQAVHSWTGETAVRLKQLVLQNENGQ